MRVSHRYLPILYAELYAIENYIYNYIGLNVSHVAISAAVANTTPTTYYISIYAPYAACRFASITTTTTKHTPFISGKTKPLPYSILSKKQELSLPSISRLTTTPKAYHFMREYSS